MTAIQLIKMLRKCPQDTEVTVLHKGEVLTIGGIYWSQDDRGESITIQTNVPK